MSKELKAFEEIKTIMNKLFGGVERCDITLDIVEKALKALEIIKEDENLVIAVMSNCKGGEEYNLLKEVLL